ncbi:hypothetical protein AGLY_000484 [Aphis glycines]|uniref:Uncharacterized protein n=1 Tax=Aphis glycines TaxID=307491 RepID=A0A6G0U745_APHGL|nr:hypothetical protein AGLY_000484 [Aphis glycines]
MNFKMKTAMFKVFATCIATLCITLPVPSRATPVLSSVSVKSEEKDENPIIENHLDKKSEILDGLKFVDLKSFDFELIANEVLREPAIAVHEQMMASREFHRQRRSFDPELEERLRKEVEKDDTTLSMPIDSKDAMPVMPPKSNEDKNSQQSNENQDDGEVNELPDPSSSPELDNSVHESNESNHPQESNESNNPRESIEHNHPQESNESNNPRESSEPNHLQESNESNNPRESSESNNLQGSNESDNPRKPNESNNPEESNEPHYPQHEERPDVPPESNESEYPPDTKSYEFDTGPRNIPFNDNDEENDDEPKPPLQKT